MALLLCQTAVGALSSDVILCQACQVAILTGLWIPELSGFKCTRNTTANSNRRIPNLVMQTNGSVCIIMASAT